MRKSLVLTAILCCVVFSNIKAQYVTIPDSLFREYLTMNYPSCMNAQGQLDTTCNGILSVTNLTLGGAGSCPFRNLAGLQYFKNLTSLTLFNIGCLENLPVINSLKVLNTPYTPVALSCLPNGLKVFDLTTGNNSYVSGLSPYYNNNNHFPDSLEVLNCQYAFNSSLDFSNGIPPFPQGLKYLDLTPTIAVTLDSLPALPPTLRHFNCGNLELRNFPALPSSITYLGWMSDFNFTGVNIPSLPPQLDTFDLNGRLMKQLPAMPSTLKFFSCWGSDTVTTFPVMPQGLKILRYNYAPSLRSMPPLPNSITEISCNQVNLTSLPALPTSLKKLVFTYDTLLTSLPALPAGLQYLECSNNKLASLPAFPTSLQYLYCINNKLTSLPELHNGLITVKCSFNKINGIQRIPNTIERLEIASNNIYCLPLIPQTPYPTVIIADSKIRCVANVNTRLSYYTELSNVPSTPKLCTPTNNERRCTSYPVIKGYIFFDANNNGIKDPGEPGKKDVKVTLAPGGSYSTFTDKNGYYELQADTLGTFTVTPQRWSSFFDLSPLDANYTFRRYDTVANQNFIISPNINFDSTNINIITYNRLRPGFPALYNVDYENAGSTTLVNPAITIQYDDQKLEFLSGSVPVNQAGNTLTYNPGNLALFAQGNFTLTFKVKPQTPLGDSVITTTTIQANSITAVDDSRERVVGSFDPNDKNATPQLSPLQVINGDYIDYTIRFQNTGTDTAFNVVISDTLNSDLQPATLQVITASHNCKTSVKDNVVFFEFLDILLPDSNVNEPQSHGFVSFRIKPQPTVQPNTTIPNKAAIYFDYNSPVITNTAGTLIKNFIVVPLRLNSFSAVPQSDNTTAVYWNTSNEINTKQFVIEQSNDGAQFTAVINVAAKGNANNSYYSSVPGVGTGIRYYRLKIIDNDGSFTYSPVIKIDRRKNAAGISILSNPVKDVLILNIYDRSLNNTNASIINMQGAIVKSFILKEGSQTVSIGNLAAGVYYLRTENSVSKFIIR